MVHKKQKIQINRNDQEGKIIEQEDDFIYFNKEVGKLRNVVQDKDTRKKIGRAEIIRICKELEEIAPKIVKLPVPEVHNDLDLNMSPEKEREMKEKFKDIFGLPDTNVWWRNRGDMKK